MISIHSLWKMREVMPLEPSAEGKKRQAVFVKGKETLLENTDYEFLKETHDGFNFMVKDGLFIVSSNEEETPVADDNEAKVAKIKADAEVNKQKAIDAASKKLERKNANKEKIEQDKQKALKSIQDSVDQKIAKLKA